MNDKTRGLFGKYKVEKITNPKKELDCIVLEFDDPNSREGIIAFAEAVRRDGYRKLHDDIMAKIKFYTQANLIRNVTFEMLTDSEGYVCLYVKGKERFGRVATLHGVKPDDIIDGEDDGLTVYSFSETNYYGIFQNFSHMIFTGKRTARQIVVDVVVFDMERLKGALQE